MSHFPIFTPLKLPCIGCMYIPHSWTKLNFSGMERIRVFRWEDTLHLRSVLGSCGLFEEKQVGAERFNFFTKCAAWQHRGVISRTSTANFFLSEIQGIIFFLLEKTMKHHETLSRCFDCFCSWFSWFLRKRPRLLPSWFVVALNNSLMKPPDLWTTPSWLSSLWYVVMLESTPGPREHNGAFEAVVWLENLEILWEMI